MATTAKVFIRWMIRRDMGKALAIETASQEHPWDGTDFAKNLQRRNCIGIVAGQGDEDVLGYAIYLLHPMRIELINIAVAPDRQKQGIGTRLVEKLTAKLVASTRDRISVDVRESNLAAQLFFKAQGFRAVGVDRGLFEDTGEDGYEMQYHLGCPTPTTKARKASR